mgnify:CR=1 FL=1
MDSLNRKFASSNNLRLVILNRFAASVNGAINRKRCSKHSLSEAAGFGIEETIEAH